MIFRTTAYVFIPVAIYLIVYGYLNLRGKYYWFEYIRIKERRTGTTTNRKLNFLRALILFIVALYCIVSSFYELYDSIFIILWMLAMAYTIGISIRRYSQRRKKK